MCGQTKNRVRHPRPATTTLNPPAAAPAPRPAFQGFPIDQPQTIDLEIDEDAVAGLSKREMTDQVLDWLLFTVVSDAGLSAGVVNDTLFDLPASRRGYMRSVASFEYGATRSRVIGNGQIVALLPQGSRDETRIDDLAQIADQHRKNLGQLPSSIIVFEYSVDPSGQSAQLTRRAEFSAKQLFTEAYGYYETRVSSLAELERFMKQIDDLTYSTLDQGTLILGGRKIKGRSYHGLRVEDVAAIWQSENKIKSNIEAYDSLVKNFNDAWGAFRRAVNALSKGNIESANRNSEMLHDLMAAEMGRKLVGGDESSQSLPPAADTAYQGLVKIIDAYNRDDVETYNQLVQTMGTINKRQLTQLNDVLRQRVESTQMVSESGFSLDPTYDFAGLESFFKERIEPSLNLFAKNLVSNADIARAKEGLARKDAEPFLRLLDKVTRSGDPELAQEINRASRIKYAFQHARYDGELQGTEVGMVLFYTDLLAKLWAIDFVNSTPSGQIADFYSVVKVPLTVTHLANVKTASRTRLWFGPQNSGFQLAGDQGNRVIFGRTATRVYSASAEVYRSGVETEANAQTGAFLNWWDAHYDEIARYEPEYQRLNEIMKWSLVVGWLNNANNISALNFLADVPVNHSNVFPEWVRRQPNLRFRDWDKIGFYPAGYKGSTTEALPILSIKYNLFGEPYTLSGGVSLAGKETFSKRPPLRSRISLPDVVRRSDLNYSAPTKTVGGGRSITNLEGVQWKMNSSSPDKAEFLAVPKKETARRDSSIELPATMGFKRTTSVSSDGMSVQSSAGAVPVADLNISKTTNGFKVGAQSRAMDVGHVIARRLSTSLDPETFLKQAPEVEEAYVHSNNSEYLIKTRGAQNWLRVGFESDNPNSPWDSRVADYGDDAGILRLKWITEQEARASQTGPTSRYKMIRGRSDNTGIARVDAFFVDNKPVNAIRALNELPANEVSQPDVLLRRAVADLAHDQNQGAYNNLQQIFDTHPDVDTVFAEINARLSANGMLPDGDQLLPVQDGKQITLIYRRKNSNLGKPLSAEEAKALDLSGAYLFVQDTQGLGNQDWSPGMESRTLQQVLSNEKGTVIKLPPGDIARFKPAFIKDGGGGDSSAGNGGNSTRSFRSVRQSNPTSPLRTSQYIPCVSSNNDDPTRKKDDSVLCAKREKDRPVYVVVAK